MLFGLFLALYLGRVRHVAFGSFWLIAFKKTLVKKEKSLVWWRERLAFSLHKTLQNQKLHGVAFNKTFQNQKLPTTR